MVLARTLPYYLSGSMKILDKGNPDFANLINKVGFTNSVITEILSVILPALTLFRPNDDENIRDDRVDG